mgnify:CR=1 FL=1
MDAEPKLVSGDFNSDGFDDVAILWMTWLETNAFRLDILLNDGHGGLYRGTSSVLGSNTIQTLFVPYPDTMLVLEDLNSDGRNDVFIAIAKNDAGAIRDIRLVQRLRWGFRRSSSWFASASTRCWCKASL